MRAMTVVCAVGPCFFITKTFSFSHQSLQIDGRHCSPLMIDAKPINPCLNAKLVLFTYSLLLLSLLCFPTCPVQLFHVKLTHNYDIVDVFLLPFIWLYILYSNNYNFHISL